MFETMDKAVEMIKMADIEEENIYPLLAAIEEDGIYVIYLEVNRVDYDGHTLLYKHKLDAAATREMADRLIDIYFEMSNI